MLTAFKRNLGDALWKRLGWMETLPRQGLAGDRLTNNKYLPHRVSGEN